MNESIKASLLFLFMASTLGACVLWNNDRPDGIVWAWRWVLVLTAIGSVTTVFLLQARRDLVPDLLGQIHSSYFTTNGLCFSFRIASDDGVAQAIVDFQNQFDQPCRAIIGLRPARKFFMNRNRIAHVLIPVECPSGGFGTSTVPIAIPLNIQGKRAQFEVGATVEFPKGKGKRLRFRNGIFLRANAKMKDPVSTAIVLAGLASGTLIHFTPAKIKTLLPKSVSEYLPSAPRSSQEIHWKYDDSTALQTIRDQAGPLTASV